MMPVVAAELKLSPDRVVRDQLLMVQGRAVMIPSLAGGRLNMRIRLLILAVFVLSAAAVAGASQDDSLSFSRPSFESVALKAEPKSLAKLYEDKEYAFHYVRPGQPDRPAALFVYAKRPRKWVEIRKLSTENAKPGRIPTGEDVSASIGKKPYVEMPLKTGKTSSLPARIRYDGETELYLLEFDSWQKKEEFVTRFYIDKEDLDESFAKLR